MNDFRLRSANLQVCATVSSRTYKYLTPALSYIGEGASLPPMSGGLRGVVLCLRRYYLGKPKGLHSRTAMPHRFRPYLLILGLYATMLIGLTWPWAAHFTSHAPGEATWAFDESTFMWNIWRFKHNILDLQQSPLHTTDIFWPLGIDLVLYTYNFLNALLGLPLLMVAGLPLTSNLTIAFAYIFSGYGTYLLIRYLLRATPHAPYAAFMGGAIYTFSASRAIFAALGHYDIVSTAFIPFFTLYFLKTLRAPGRKNPLMAALFATLCLLAEMIFGVFLLFLGLILLFHHRRHTLKQWLRIIGRLILLAIMTALLWSPALIPIGRAFSQERFDLQGWGESLGLSADVVGWFTLSPLHPMSGQDWVSNLRQVQEKTAPFSDVNTVFLGYGIVTLALLGALTQWRKSNMWLTVSVIFALFTLGPLLQINGQYLFPMDNLLREQGITQDVTFPMPFMILHYLPIIRANRAPARFAVILTLALAILAAHGAAYLLNLNAKRGEKLNANKDEKNETREKNLSHLSPLTSHFSPLTSYSLLLIPYSLLLTFVLFDQLAIPLPLTDNRVPQLYYDLAAEPDEYAIMQLPLGWRNSFGTLGAEQTQLQYYQHIHHKAMLGGNISRAPAFKFDYYRNIPLFMALTETEFYRQPDDLTLNRAREQAGALMRLYNVKYLVIHDPLPQRKPYEDTFTATQSLALDIIPHAPQPVYQSPGVRAYLVQAPDLPDPFILDLGDWTSDPYRGAGWAGNETIFAATANWITAPQAELFIPVQGEGNRQLSLSIAPFSYPNAPPQQLTMWLNDTNLNQTTLNDGWQTITVTLPAPSLQQGLNRLKLSFSHTAQPRQVIPANFAIGQTGFNIPLDIELNSGADFAYMTLGFGAEATDVSTHRRGMNVAILQPDTGEFLDKRGFDTVANEFEAEALTKYLGQIKTGQIILLTTQGMEATTYFNSDTWAVLAELGLNQANLTPPFSVIAVKGMTGAAIASGENGAYLRLGRLPDTRSLAAAVDKIGIRN